MSVSSTPSRPALLTLTGIYQTSKSVYVSYMPEAASKTVESLAEKILSASSPLVASIQKALPKETEKTPVEQEVTPDLSVAKLDSLVASLCTEADSRLDEIIAMSSVRISDAKETVQSKACAVKSAVESKAGAVKTVVHETLGVDRVEALKQRCTGICGDVSTTASSYYSTAQELTPAARQLTVQYSQLLQSELASKGMVATTQAILCWAKDQAVFTLNILKEQGPVEGVKSICANLIAAVTDALDQAKTEQTTASVVNTAPRANEKEATCPQDEKETTRPQDEKETTRPQKRKIRMAKVREECTSKNETEKEKDP